MELGIYPTVPTARDMQLNCQCVSKVLRAKSFTAMVVKVVEEASG